MTNAVAGTKESDGTLASLLRQPNYANRFKEVLGDRAGQFVSSVLSVGATMKDVEPTSIISSAMIAASLDLPINKNLGFAWIVPYSDKGRKVAQFQMGYKGFIQLALRTGQYSRMNVRGVNAEALGGHDEVGEPIIDWSKIDETKESVGYAFAFKLTNGFTKVCYWSRAKVEGHARQYSQSYRGQRESPWKTHFDAMAMKTVVKNELSRWGMLSVQFQEALFADQSVETDDGPQFMDNQPEPLKKPPLETARNPLPVIGVVAEVGKEDPRWPVPEGVEPIVVEQPKPASSPPVDLKAEGLPTETVAPDPYAVLTGILEKNGIDFDDFKDWLESSGREQQGRFVADALTKMSDLPLPFATALAADTKAMDKCVRLYKRTS